MYKRLTEKDFIKTHPQYKRVYRGLLEELKILRCYQGGSFVAYFFNRLNPLSWLYLLCLLILMPIICILTEGTLKDFKDMFVRALLGVEL